jgi:hypothetical protein
LRAEVRDRTLTEWARRRNAVHPRRLTKGDVWLLLVVVGLAAVVGLLGTPLCCRDDRITIFVVP